MREPDAGRRSAAKADPGDRPRAEGRRRRAQSRGPEAHWGERGAGGDGGSGRAMSRDGENDSFAFGASLLGFIELGP